MNSLSTNIKLHSLCKGSICRHYPDPELEATRQYPVESLSSIFVKIPEVRYGTRYVVVIAVFFADVSFKRF